MRQYFVLLLLLMLSFYFVIPTNGAPGSPATITTVTTIANQVSPPVENTGFSYHYKVFFASSRWWIFWANGLIAQFSTSTDGITWSTPAQLGTATANSARDFDVWYDGIFIYYAFSLAAVAPSVFRRGTPNTDGTITWSAVEQTIYTSHTGVNIDEMAVAADSNHKPFVAWEGRTQTPVENCTVDGSSTTDGTWVETGRLTLNNTNAAWWDSIIQLTTTKMYAFCEGGNILGVITTWGYLFNGASWVTTPEFFGQSDQQISFPSVYTDSSGDIFATWMNQTDDTRFHILYTTRSISTGKWSKNVEVASASGAAGLSSPSIFKNNRGEPNIVWHDNGSPSTFIDYNINTGVSLKWTDTNVVTEWIGGNSCTSFDTQGCVSGIATITTSNQVVVLYSQYGVDASHENIRVALVNLNFQGPFTSFDSGFVPFLILFGILIGTIVFLAVFAIWRRHKLVDLTMEKVTYIIILIVIVFAAIGVGILLSG